MSSDDGRERHEGEAQAGSHKAKFVERSQLCDPIPTAEYGLLALFATRKEASEAARAVGWRAGDVARARGRFQVLWGIYNAGQGYMTESFYRELLQARSK
jgi:hypothetical protein